MFKALVAAAKNAEAGGGGEAKKGKGIGLFALGQLKKWSGRQKSISDKGIPVREGLQCLYKIRRDSFMKEAIVFCLFVLTLMGITFLAYDVHTVFSQNDALIDLFLDEEFAGASYKKNFFEIMQREEVWEWLQGPLINGAFPDEWYNGQPFSTDENGYMLHLLRLVGSVQLRQQRVRNDSCVKRRFLDLGNRFDTKDGTCFDEFSDDAMETTPFGPPGDPTKYQWRSGLSELDGLYGFGPSYGTGGYVTLLPQNRTEAIKIIQQLKDDLWIDRGTRVVAINFNAYNTETRLLSVLRILFEFYASGRIQTSYKFYSEPLVLYASAGNVMRAVLEVVYVIFWIIFFAKEAYRFRWTRPKVGYFMEFRNVFEVILLGFSALTIFRWVTFVTNPLIAEFNVNMVDYEDYFEMSYDFLITFTFLGFTFLMCSLKVFKYLSLSKRMNTLWLTLWRASGDLVAFCLAFGVILLGFALMAQLLFGGMLAQFHNLVSSFSSLLRFPLGDFNYQQLSITRPKYAGPFFTVYVGLVFLIILNMFIAIVTSYFEIVHKEVKDSENWKKGSEGFEADLLRPMLRFTHRCCPFLFRASGDEKLNRTTEQKFKFWDKQEVFFKLLADSSRAAFEQKNLDLFAYFEKAYGKDASGKNEYISLDELCGVLRKTKSCEHDENCLARKLINSYRSVKTVLMVGAHERFNMAKHQTELDSYKVVKVNRFGFKQHRVLYVDPHRKELRNYSEKGDFKRHLNLSDLIQVDKSNLDKRRLRWDWASVCVDACSSLCFSGEYETQYNLIFESAEDRNRFLGTILQATQELKGTKKTAAGEEEEESRMQADLAQLQRQLADLQQLVNASMQTREEVENLTNRVLMCHNGRM